MVCFCKPSLTPLLSATAQLKASLTATVALPALPPILLSLSEMLTLAPPSPFPAEMLGAIEQFHLPQLSIMAGLPTLMGLANLALQMQLHLGIDITTPIGLEALAQLTAQIDLPLLAPLATLPVSALIKLSALLSLTAQIKAVLGLDLMNPPADFEARLAVALQIFLPQIPFPSFVLPKLQLMAQLRPLLALAIALKIDLLDPAALAAIIRPLISLKLNAVIVPPQLLSALSLLSLLPKLDIDLTATATASLTDTINARIGQLLAGMKLLFQAMVKLNLALPLPALLPALTMPEIELILRLNLPQLAAINWQIPTTLPVLQIGLPLVSLMAHLQMIVPAIRLSPCTGGCLASAF